MITARSAKKHAKGILRHIEQASGYTATRRLRKILMKNLVVTIRANSEVQQSYIDSLVRIFGHARAERERRERTEAHPEHTVLSAS